MASTQRADELEEKPMTIRTPDRTARHLTRLAAAAGGVVLAVGLAAPASAASTTYVDGADASASLNDILRVRAHHGAERVKVVVTFDDLRKRSSGGPAGIAVFLDTKQGRKGPEFRLDSGLQSGTDYTLHRAKNWKPVGDPKTCRHDVDLMFTKDKLVFTSTRACIGTPARLRVGAKMTDFFDASHPVHDWMKGPRRWTSTIASG
jgi:hypothetical protein